MSTYDKKPVNYLVVDSSVLIRRAPLKDLAENVYSVSAVVSEIKDARTKEYLQVLPFDFKFKEPISSCIKFVSEFARKTGDYHNLSAVDLHLIALTYQMCKENLSSEDFERLKSEPPKENQHLINATNVKLDKAVNIAGFYIPSKQQTKKNETSESPESSAPKNNIPDLSNLSLDSSDHLDKSNLNESQGETKEEDEDDNIGWITPSNLAEVKKINGVHGDEQEVDKLQIQVGCMTSDFSMQNVLIQIGIPVLSVDGLLIKRPRSYVLKCVTCSKITTNMSKQFCPFCGYKSMERVVVTLDENGNKVYRGRRKTPSAKSMTFSLPMPRGGKHDNFPLLSVDQPRAQQLPSKKSLERNNPLDPDYATFTSPFVTKDVNSKASRLGYTNRFNKRH